MTYAGIILNWFAVVSGLLAAYYWFCSLPPQDEVDVEGWHQEGSSKKVAGK
jgi:hypothetical protein